ncbi:MAG: CopG family transcriptional regulator [Dehalococcoidia bacterium]
MTVVFDDELLARDLKVRAAEEGVSIKALIERLVTEYVRGGPRARKVLTPEMLEGWFAETDRLAEEVPGDAPTDLSDVKHHLYGWPKRAYSPGDWAKMAGEANREHGLV